jgi:site-specific recombinase XerD
MSYSIKAVVKGYADHEDKTKVFIQVIYRRMKVYAPTIVKVPKDNFVNGVVVKHVLKARYNAEITEYKSEIENRLLDVLRHNKDLSKEQLTEVVKGTTASTDTLSDYMDVLAEELHGKITKGRISQLKTLVRKVELFHEDVRLSDIDVKWLNRFESWLRKQPGRDGLMEPNTVQTKMKMVHAILGYAKKAGLVEAKQYEGYEMPAYEQKLPDYLTEIEMDKLYKLLQVVDQPGRKLAGYYFLLGCYAGYRISDLKRFNYSERVKGSRIILRAKKNRQIVSIIIHTRLQQVLDFIHDKPLYLSEQHVRDYVKELANNIGLGRKIKVHTSRHSFGMLLAENGFSLDEAAELLGDSKEVAKVYFRMSNKRLDDKVLSRLG